MNYNIRIEYEQDGQKMVHETGSFQAAAQHIISLALNETGKPVSLTVTATEVA